MKILIVNCYCDTELFNRHFNSLKIKPEVSIQKYFDLFLRGITANGVNVDVISERQISYHEKGLFYKGYKSEVSKRINIKYIPLITIPVLYQLGLIIHALFYTPLYFLKYGKPDIIICDIMRFYSSFPTLLISKIFGIKTLGFAADIPQMYHHQERTKQPWIKRLLKKMYSNTSIYYDGYVLLSSYMNEHVNRHKKKYFILEGLVRKDDYASRYITETKSDAIKSFMYAGGLYENYGVKSMIEAFKLLGNKDVELWLFGKGDLENYIHALNDDRIKYFGYRDNEFVTKMQKNATFLINPRPSSATFTKYSFPSKIMEYMVSGTPVITTKLLGIPHEYWKHLIPIEDESIEGLLSVFRKSLLLSNDFCKSLGESARKFVISEKNNIIQGERLILWIRNLISK